MVKFTEEEKYVISKTKKFLPSFFRTSFLTGDHTSVSVVLNRLCSLLRLSDKVLPEHFRTKDSKIFSTTCYTSSEIVSFYTELFDKAPSSHSLYDNGIELLCELFCLDDVQRVGLEYLVWRVLDSEINYVLDVINKPDLSDFYYNYLRKYFRFETNTIGTYDYWYYFKSLNFLTSYDSFEPTHQFRSVVGLLKSDNREQMLNALLDKEQESTFCLADFSWVKKDCQVLKKLLTKVTAQKIRGVNILLYGVPGTGKTEFAKALAKACGIRCYAVKTEDKYGACVKQEDKMADLYIKQALLSHREKACILFDEAEDVMSKDYLSKDGIGKNYLNRVLENAVVPVIWTTNSIDVDPAFLRRMTYCVQFKQLTTRQRKNVWKAVLDKQAFKLEETKLTNLVKTYDVPVSIISNAVKCTKLINGKEEQLKGFIESVGKIALPYGYKTEPKKKKASMMMYSDEYTNTDIDLALLTKRLVKVKKLNFSMCLYGEPGTGKSYYAKHLAKLLKIKVVYKRVSDLIDPYVGQTERNIAAAFEEAKREKAMLIFDEADSFLLNRLSAHQTWEITKVNEMLTQMEAAKYPFICTTNLMDRLDEACLRRFTFKVRFDFMGEQQTRAALSEMFKIEKPEHIRGLTIGDCMTVKKKAKFLGVTKPDELMGMLEEEVKIKKSNNLTRIGF